MRRTRHQSVTGNRTLSLLSTIFGGSIEWKLGPHNRCSGVKRYGEAPSQAYVTDEMFTALTAGAIHCL